MSDTACTLVRKERRLSEKRRKSSQFPFTHLHRDIGILFVGYTSALYSSFYVSLSLVRARKRATRSRIHPHSLSIAEALSAVIGPWCHTIGQTIRGTIHPPASRDYPALFTRGTHSPIHRRLLSSLGISTSRQLNKHNSWLCRPAVTMRAPRKEIPKIRDTGIVRPALSLSRLPRMDYTPTDGATVDLPFAKNLSTREGKKRKVSFGRFTFSQI